MKRLKLFLVGLIIFLASQMGFSLQNKAFRFEIRIFGIPCMQSVVSGGEVEKGVVRGTMRGGDITASFPGHAVLIRTELEQGASETQIKEVLYEQGFFKEAKRNLTLGIGWVAVGDFSFFCAENELGQETSRKDYHEAPPSSGNPFSEYWLAISPKSAREGEALLGVRFTGLVITTEFPAGKSQILLDQDVAIPLGKILLIGFPEKRQEIRREPCSRGSVYIMALICK
jgi:hypothetical protein